MSSNGQTGMNSSESVPDRYPGDPNSIARGVHDAERPAGRLMPAPAHGWWMAARCAGHGPAVFFNEDVDPHVVQAFCANCSVRLDCLLDGLTDPFGIWGGLRKAERDRLLRLRARLSRDADHLDNARDLVRLIDTGADAADLEVICGLDSASLADLVRRGKADLAQQAASRSRRSLRHRLADSDPTVPHGRRSVYNAGCRCQTCRDTMAFRQRERTAQRALRRAS